MADDRDLGTSLAYIVLGGWWAWLQRTTGEDDQAGTALTAAAVTWVRTHLGDEPGAAAQQVSPLLVGGPDRDEMTAMEQTMGLRFIPAMLWLVAGAVVARLDGDSFPLPTAPAAIEVGSRR